MPRPLTAALARLAELRDERKRRARDRFKVVAGDWPNRTDALRQVDAWRAEVDEEIRQTKALVAQLMAKRDDPRVAKPRPTVTRVCDLRRVVARAG
jgi:hypothetical protein